MQPSHVLVLKKRNVFCFFAYLNSSASEIAPGREVVLPYIEAILACFAMEGKILTVFSMGKGIEIRKFMSRK